jgi:hypothetical protein
MACVVAVRVESEHVASHKELVPDVPSDEGAAAEQVAMVAPLSVKATVPVRLVVPEGAVMTALKLIGVAWFTVPEAAEDERVMLIGAVPTDCVTGALVLVTKLFVLSV